MIIKHFRKLRSICIFLTVYSDVSFKSTNCISPYKVGFHRKIHIFINKTNQVCQYSTEQRELWKKSDKITFTLYGKASFPFPARHCLSSWLKSLSKMMKWTSLIAPCCIYLHQTWVIYPHQNCLMKILRSLFHFNREDKKLIMLIILNCLRW